MQTVDLKQADIVVVYSPIVDGKDIGPHPFIVLDARPGTITGLSFDFVAMILSSMDTEERHQKMLRFDGNFPVASDDKAMNTDSTRTGRNKDSFVRADQFFYFTGSTRYKKIGEVKRDIFELILEHIEHLSENGTEIIQHIENL